MPLTGWQYLQLPHFVFGFLLQLIVTFIHWAGDTVASHSMEVAGNSNTWKPMNFHYRNKADIWHNTTQ